MPGDADFRALLRDHGIYHCADGMRRGLAVSNAEADTLRAKARETGLRVRLHPRTFLLETRRRVAVVLDWHLPYASCPFLVDYRCTVYDTRPLVCRAFPVMLAPPPGAPMRPALAFAPECPKAPAPIANVRVELRARREIDTAHAALDAAAGEALATKGARFALGLTSREAARRVARYRKTTPEEFLRARAMSSTS